MKTVDSVESHCKDDAKNKTEIHLRNASSMKNCSYLYSQISFQLVQWMEYKTAPVLTFTRNNFWCCCCLIFFLWFPNKLKPRSEVGIFIMFRKKKKICSNSFPNIAWFPSDSPYISFIILCSRFFLHCNKIQVHALKI